MSDGSKTEPDVSFEFGHDRVAARMARDPNVPTIAPTPTERGGRGLLLVDGLAEDWGVEPTETGKVVWAKFEKPNAPGDAAPRSAR